jgi:flagellar biogenesis protein FliO
LCALAAVAHVSGHCGTQGGATRVDSLCTRGVRSLEDLSVVRPRESTTEKPRFDATFRTVMLWLSLLLVVFLAWHFAQIQKKEMAVKFSEFMAQVESGQVADVTITGSEIKGHNTNRQSFKTFAPGGYDRLVDALLAKKVTVSYEPDQTPAWANMLISWAPFILLIGLWIFFMRQMQRGRTNRTADDFAVLLAQVAQLEQLLAEARRIGTQTTVSLILESGGRGADGESGRLVVPAAADVVSLRLDVLRTSAYRSQRAVRALIRTPEGHQVWGRDGLRMQVTHSGAALIVEIPARVLPTGEYSLILSGFTHAGDIKDIADYSFGIVTR